MWGPPPVPGCDLSHPQMAVALPGYLQYNFHRYGVRPPLNRAGRGLSAAGAQMVHNCLMENRHSEVW